VWHLTIKLGVFHTGTFLKLILADQSLPIGIVPPQLFVNKISEQIS